MAELLKSTGTSTSTLQAVNHETERLVSTLNSYTASIQSIQNELQRTLTQMNAEDKSVHALIQHEKNMLMEQGNIIMELKRSIADMTKYSKDTNGRVNEALEEITNGVDYMRKLNDKRLASAGKN